MQLFVSVVRTDGVAALVTTHDPAVAALADRVLELHDGRLVRG
jgi:putative ABC transport system ATP-binding protein